LILKAHVLTVAVDRSLPSKVGGLDTLGVDIGVTLGTLGTLGMLGTLGTLGTLGMLGMLGTLGSLGSF